MTVPLARSTAEYLCTVHNELGPGWWRALAGELTAEDAALRMTDLGECPQHVHSTCTPAPAPLAGVTLAREIGRQMKLGAG